MSTHRGLPARQRTVTVYLHHSSDDASAAAMEWIARHASAGSVDAFVVVSSEPGETTDAVVHSRSGALAGDLLDLLSKARVLETLRVVTVEGSPASDETTADLLAWLGTVRRRLDQTKGRGTVIQDVRVRAVSADEQIDSSGVFAPQAFANVILIPHDRASDRSMARLVRRSDAERFAMHVGTELATLTGAWTGLAEAPLDSVLERRPSGNDVQVVFMRSLVRALFCPPLPLDRVVAPGQGLPAPEGFFPSPSPAATLAAVQHQTYPDSMRFHPGVRPVFERRIPFEQALRAVPKHIGNVIKSLPRILRSGLGRDIKTLGGDGIQELVGRSSWLQVTFPDRQEDTSMAGWDERAEQGIALLEQRDALPVLSKVSPTIWSDLIGRVLGIADGSSISTEAREQSGENRFLVTDPVALCVPPGSTPHGTVDILMLCLDPDEPEAAEGPAEGDSYDSGESAEQTSTFPPPSFPPPEAAAAPRRSLRESLTDGGSVSLPIGGLVGAITHQMAEEKAKADSRLESMLAELRAIIAESQEAGRGRTVPFVIRFLLAAATMVSIFSLCVFTGAAKVTDLHWMEFRWQALLWFLLTLAVAVPATAVLAGVKRLRGLGALMPVAVLAGAVVLSFHSKIRASLFVTENIGQTFWPLWPISLATIGIGIAARVSAPNELGQWRSALGRLTAWATCTYALFVAIYGGSSAKSSLQSFTRTLQRLTEAAEKTGVPLELPSPADQARHILDSTRQMALVVSLVLSALVFVACLLIIGVMWVRVDFANRDRAKRFVFAQNEAEHASLERRKLQLLTTQWLGSASALARMVWRPLGEIEAGNTDDQSDLIAANDLLKFDIAGLELTERGHQLLLVRLRSLLVRQGWLLDQYERATEAFLEMDPSLADAKLRREEWPRPEADPAAIPLGDILAGNTTGRRWDFATALYNGELDDALQKVITENTPERVFESILRDPSAHRTVGAIDEEADLLEFFQGLLPAGGQDLPIGLSNAVFVAGDPRREMKTLVSWPPGFMSAQIDNAHVIDSVEPSIIDGSVIIAVRCDLSQPFQLSEVGTITWSIDDESGDTTVPAQDLGIL